MASLPVGVPQSHQPRTTDQKHSSNKKKKKKKQKNKKKAETQLRNRSGALFHQPGRGITTERAVKTTEQLGRSPQYPRQALVIVIQSKPRSRG